MSSRIILGNLINQTNQVPANVKQLSVSNNWFALRGSNNKENVVGKISKTKKTPKLWKSPKIVKSCDVNEEENQLMEIEVSDSKSDEDLPKGVIEIDSEEGNDGHLWSFEYSREVYAYLCQLETKHSIKEDFLRGFTITSKMRSLLIDWMVSVHQQFELLPETLFLSRNILDRYLQLEGRNTERDQLQLVGVVAMLIASKIEEIYIPAIEDFVFSTDNAYTREEITEMELKIMNTLNFNLTCPIALTFLRRFSRAGDVDVLEHSVSKYILELCLMDYGQVAIPASMSAAAALHLSLLLLEPQTSSSVWNTSLEFYSGYTSACLMPLVQRMATVLVNAETHRLQAVRNKYSSRKLRKVAMLPEMKEDFIANRVSLG